jgi:hypothetical protein
MDTPDKSGSSRRAHLRQVEKTSGKTPEELLENPELPEPVKHVWEWWYELHNARSAGGMGQSPITYLDIQAWAKMSRQEPTPWEVQALREMDKVYMSWSREKGKKESPKQGDQS